MANPMPFDGALAIDSQGHVWGWGLNAIGDLCLSGLTELRPSELPLSDVTLATGARTHSLFDSGGKVYACGAGEYGVLGTGSTTSSSTPVPVVGLPGTARVTALTSSWEGSGALLSNGTYYDWGYNAAGQLGNGTTTDSAVPVRVAFPRPCDRCSRAAAGQERPDGRHPGQRLGVGVGQQRPGSARRRHEGQFRRSRCRVDVPTRGDLRQR